MKRLVLLFLTGFFALMLTACAAPPQNLSGTMPTQNLSGTAPTQVVPKTMPPQEAAGTLPAQLTPTKAPLPTPQPVDEMIYPGDKIGDFLITTSDDDDVTYTTTIHCPFDQSTLTETCEIPIGTKVNVALGVYGDSVEKLDAYWSDQTYEMTIDGRAVNLQAFGSIDINHPVVHMMRLWNVVIVSDKPGKITIQHSGELIGESMEGTNILVYTMP